MCWAAVVDGQVFVHWLTPGSTVNGLAYLRLLKEGLWPKIRHKVRRDSLWFQQDGAIVHTTAAVRQWLAGKFDGRVISRLTERSWPSRSPDLTPLDYWFWAVALEELRRNPPATLQELQVTVERFAGNLDRNDMWSARCGTSARGPKPVSGEKATQWKIREEHPSACDLYINPNVLLFYLSIKITCVIHMSWDIVVSKVTFIMKNPVGRYRCT